MAALAGIMALAAPLACTTPAPTAPPDRPVMAWDIHTQAAVMRGEAVYVSDNTFAMVNGAVFDAVNAIAGTPYEPYLVAPPATGGESVDAAVATAAFRVLAAVFPRQLNALQATYDRALAAVPGGPARDAGVAVGARAAEAMVAARTGDGRYAPVAWPTGTEPGRWRPTPPVYGGDAAWLGDVRTFAFPSGSAFRMPGPPALTSARYTRDYEEAKAVGGAWSATRTPDQAQAARFWNAAPLSDWEMKRQVATTVGLDTLETARLFALTDLARADAHIACFNEKKHWSFWRPITAIRLADQDGNPDTAPDPAWSPLLGVTPPFPDYPSGHACATVAHMVVHQRVLGRDDIPFSASVAGMTRRYTSFSQAADEVSMARVWGGIHFRTAVEDGARLGTTVADHVVTTRLRPRPT